MRSDLLRMGHARHGQTTLAYSPESGLINRLVCTPAAWLQPAGLRKSEAQALQACFCTLCKVDFSYDHRPPCPCSWRIPSLCCQSWCSEIQLTQGTSFFAKTTISLCSTKLDVSDRFRYLPVFQVSGMSPKMKVVLALTMLVDYSCTDQYQPNIPAMAKFFMVSPTEMGFTIQIHLLFCALGMTVVGPLSDRIGRRPVILACQLMQAISTVTCMCALSVLCGLLLHLSQCRSCLKYLPGASSIGWFMAGRAIQGLAASVYVAILASMRDCFDDAASRQRAMGAMMSVMLIGPIFAPAVGGYLTSDFGWRCPFGLLAIFAVALACISYHVIHETAPAHEEASNLAPASAVVA